MIDLNELKPQIEQKIIELGEQFRQDKGLILTEGDLHCHVFNKLFQIKALSELAPIIDEGYESIPLHSLVSWFNESGYLGNIPDISIIDPANLKIIPESGLGYIFPVSYTHLTLPTNREV